VILHPSDNTDPGIEFAYPKITLRVGRQSLVRAGDVVHTDGGYFLVATHSNTEDYNNFHLFRCDRQVTWTRPATKLDPVTKQKVADGAPVTMGTPWVMWERNRREYADLPIRFNQETTLSATGSLVQIGDFLNGVRVSRVNEALGIRVLELQA
jgi:hypothetical protein